jgi:hypothetical protein
VVIPVLLAEDPGNPWSVGLRKSLEPNPICLIAATVYVHVSNVSRRLIEKSMWGGIVNAN